MRIYTCSVMKMNERFMQMLVKKKVHSFLNYVRRAVFSELILK